MLQIPKPQLVTPSITNLAATPVAATPGTTVAASASPNTKGSWVQLFAAATVTYDVYGVTLVILSDGEAGGTSRNLYDIGVGAAASEVVKVPNILNTTGTMLQPLITEMFFPIFIPKGTRIAMRKQSDNASQTSSCLMFLHGGGGIPPWATFAGCDSYGTDVATSGGQVHTPGNSGSYSSWANFGSALSRDYGLIIPMAGWGSDTAGTNLVGYLQLGINSVEFCRYIYWPNTSESIPGMLPSIPIYHRWASGSQMMLRSTVSGTADTNYEYGFLAFY